MALTGFACLLNLTIPLLVQRLVDQVVAGGRWWNLPAYAVALLAVFAIQALLGLANGLVVGRMGQGVVRDLRHRLYERLQRLGLSYYDKTPTGAIISRLMDDVGAIQAFVTGASVTILTDLGTAAVISVVLVTRSGRLGLVMAVFVGLHAFTFPYFLRKIRATNRIIRAKMDRLFGHLKERIDGSLVIQAYARERAEETDFADKLADVHVPRVREGQLSAALSNLSVGISGVGTAAIFAMAAAEVLNGRLSAGAVVSTTVLAGLLFGPIARLADLAYIFEQASASVDRLGEILDLEPAVADPPVPIKLPRVRGRVEFDRVGFAYVPGTPVLRDIRIRVEPGRKVALVGPTGCGKSTLINLLLRFYDPVAGEIRLDDVPIHRLAARDLRRCIGVVPQEAVIFRQSIADNIRYGAPAASDEQVEAAARAALVHGFALSLPDGYATIVGEGAGKLSHGERQRVAIARAFCMDPALIVLDEATSALDTAGEALIQAALANLMRGRTAFIIAHRLATIIDADEIVVLDAGRIVQSGTHNDLLADEDGLYRRLCLRQFGESALIASVRAGGEWSVPAPHLGGVGSQRRRSSA